MHNMSKQQQIHMASFDLLYMELVNYIMSSSPSPDVALTKLEHLGFVVGQRLVER